MFLATDGLATSAGADFRVTVYRREVTLAPSHNSKSNGKEGEETEFSLVMRNTKGLREAKDKEKLRVCGSCAIPRAMYAVVGASRTLRFFPSSTTSVTGNVASNEEPRADVTAISPNCAAHPEAVITNHAARAAASLRLQCTTLYLPKRTPNIPAALCSAIVEISLSTRCLCPGLSRKRWGSMVIVEDSLVLPEKYAKLPGHALVTNQQPHHHQGWAAFGKPQIP